MLLENNHYSPPWGEASLGSRFLDTNSEGSSTKYCSHSSIVGGSLEHIPCDHDRRPRSGLIAPSIGRQPRTRVLLAAVDAEDKDIFIAS